MRGIRVGTAIALTVLMLAAPAKASWTSARVVPKLDAATTKALVATRRRGIALGRRADVFAKVGDSMSSSGAFLQQLGCGAPKFGGYSNLLATVRYFRSRSFAFGASTECAALNSFSRDSAATRPYASSSWPLRQGENVDPSCSPAEAPLRCEIRLERPAYAVIMLGTNDVTIAQAFQSSPLDQYLANMSAIVTAARSLGVVPVLTTVPPRIDPSAEGITEAVNAGLVALAHRRHAPLINLWAAFQPLPNHGLSADDLHPSLFGGPECTGDCHPRDCAPACQAANFTAAALTSGYNRRNLITVQTLRRLASVGVARDGMTGVAKR